jgi:hypothetical protein
MKGEGRGFLDLASIFNAPECDQPQGQGLRTIRHSERFARCYRGLLFTGVSCLRERDSRPYPQHWESRCVEPRASTPSGIQPYSESCITGSRLGADYRYEFLDLGALTPGHLTLSGIVCDVIKSRGEARSGTASMRQGQFHQWRAMAGVDQEPDKTYISGGAVLDAYWIQQSYRMP